MRSVFATLFLGHVVLSTEIDGSCADSPQDEATLLQLNTVRDKFKTATHLTATPIYGTVGENTCPTPAVSEADCLAAVQQLLPAGVTQGRTNLVSGSWGWVPPGCSVQSHFTHGQDGDWAAHYNSNAGGNNDGGYTPVCSVPYHYGTSGENTCPTMDVDEANCLAAVQRLLPVGVTQGRTNLVAGSWGWVPPGCSVQSHFTHGQDGDWAAHYNRNAGGSNDGGYTPVCASNEPTYGVAATDTKCPHNHGDRLFRSPGSGSGDITLEQCYALCAATEGCNHFSHGAWQGAFVCMGCTTLENSQTHDGFTAYDMNPTHYVAVVSWPAWAWGDWNEDTQGPIAKCLSKDQTEDPAGDGIVFTSCCSADGEGLSRDCSTTRNTNFESAQALCAAQGGRLCSAAESLAIDSRGRGTTVTRGCSVDGPQNSVGGPHFNRHWTSTPCNPPQMCRAGVGSDSGLACCAASCGTCGGSGCGSRPGGASNCCHQHVTGQFNDGTTADFDWCASEDDVACAIP